MRDAAVQLFRHPARAFHNRVQIIANAVGFQAKFLGSVHQMEHFGRPQHGLRRDTAPIEANPTHVFALYDGNFQTQLAGPNGGNITARPCSYHDDIKGFSSHFATAPNLLNVKLSDTDCAKCHPLKSHICGIADMRQVRPGM